MIEAVLFDLGDTLLDFAPVPRRQLFHSAAQSTYQYLQSRGISLPPFPRYFSMHIRAVYWEYVWATLRGREANSFNALQKWCRKNNYPCDDASVRELIWMWYQPIVPQSSVAPDVIPALTQLRDDGLKLALVSNTLLPGCVLDRHLEILGLKNLLPIRVYSSEVCYRKPNPIIFQAALDQLQVPAASCAFVGDLVKTDIKGARRMGMTTVLRLTPRKQNINLANYRIKCIGELPALIRELCATAPATPH